MNLTDVITTLATSLPHSRWATMPVALDNHIYVISGYGTCRGRTEANHTDTILVYDMDNEEWHELKCVKYEVHSGGCVVLKLPTEDA